MLADDPLFFTAPTVSVDLAMSHSHNVKLFLRFNHLAIWQHHLKVSLRHTLANFIAHNAHFFL
jgi:hypothetical protein